MKKMIALLAAGLLAGPVLADESTRYATASSFNWAVKAGERVEGSGARLTLGQALNDYLSVEAHLAMGGGSDSLKLKRQLGAYLRADWPVTESLRIHGRYGYVETKLEAVLPVGPGHVSLANLSDRGGSYGAGIELRVLPNVLDGRLSLTADYTVFEEGGGTKVDARSIGLRLDLR